MVGERVVIFCGDFGFFINEGIWLGDFLGIGLFFVFRCLR